MGLSSSSYTPFESPPRLNNSAECISVWETTLQDSTSVSKDTDPNTADNQATYITPEQCRYLYNQLTNLSFYYDSRNRQVITDSDPND